MPREKAITVRELSERLAAPFEGDGDTPIRTVATLEAAGADALSWVGDEELLPRAAKSKAGVILIPEPCRLPERTVIRVRDPDDAICSVLEWLAPPLIVVEPGVHATAVVSDDASVDGAAIGANVFVGAGAVVGNGSQLHPGVYVGANTKIGSDCVLWPGVVVRERIEIGDRVIIHPGAIIGADGFGYLQRDGRHKKIPQIGTVSIEDDVEVGALTSIDRARSGVTRIGRGTKIDNACQIAHNCDIGEHCMIVAHCAFGGSVTLGDHCVFGGKSGVSDHMTIGRAAQVAALSVVFGDLPEGAIVRGTPAIDIRRYRRAHAAYHKLPELVQKIREMAKRIEALEQKETSKRQNVETSKRQNVETSKRQNVETSKRQDG
ncbi:MAG: UDP-3-O-(3-hydroxymyristoyl)glucosamine N-acyltransferase [Planctomycetes bacterium]|nr:UDP-3-O-(3-hydroxymyristoyl)glucosamine N-acyltransferase [Planctomycetota bacterium]